MAILEGHKVKIFSLGTNESIAKEISQYLKVPISSCDVLKFSDGEINISIEETVRDHDVFLVTSTSFPVNENYMSLFIMMDALKRASARTINVIMPYYGYSRQDRKAKSREPISAKLVADLLQTAGASRVITMDLHASQIQGFFNIPIDNMEAHPTIADYFVKKNLDDLVIVAPDHGGTKRAIKLGEALNAPLAIIDKRRPKPNVAEVMHLVGEVEGKNCILVDDMIDTAGTIVIAINALKEKGAKDIYLACTHGLFSGEAVKRLNNADVKEIICTNTVNTDGKNIDKLVKLSVGDMFARAILCIVKGEAMSILFDNISN